MKRGNCMFFPVLFYIFRFLFTLCSFLFDFSRRTFSPERIDRANQLRNVPVGRERTRRNAHRAAGRFTVRSHFAVYERRTVEPTAHGNVPLCKYLAHFFTLACRAR